MEGNDELIVEVVAQAYKDLLKMAELYEYYTTCNCNNMPHKASIFTGCYLDQTTYESVNDFKNRIYERMRKETWNIVHNEMIYMLCEYPDIVLNQIYDYIKDHYKLFYYTILYPLIKDGDKNEKCTTN